MKQNNTSPSKDSEKTEVRRSEEGEHSFRNQGGKHRSHSRAQRCLSCVVGSQTTPRFELYGAAGKM